MGEKHVDGMEPMRLASIKALVPVALKKLLVPYLHGRQAALPDGPRSFLFLAADYGNIGDLAITAAQAAFLRKHAPGRAVVPVPISATRELIRSLHKQVRPHDLITIVGGGNMGSLYPDIEELRQLVIRSFPKNCIVCFPQTLDWNDSVESDRALARIVSVYSRHPDLHLFARESITRAKLGELFRNHSNVSIGYVPDIVLSATAGALGSVSGRAPSGILRCLRDDRERALDPARYAQLDEALADLRQVVEVTDTHAGGSQLDEAHCGRMLSGKIDQFRAARLVVTDRLHGMILSLLAGTPCLVLPNANHKIKQTWRDWLSEHPQVRFMDPDAFDTLPYVLDELLTTPRRDPVTAPVDDRHYESLRQALVRI